MQICEHLPSWPRCADKFAILRGVSHTLAGARAGHRVHEHRQPADAVAGLSRLRRGRQQGTAGRPATCRPSSPSRPRRRRRATSACATPRLQTNAVPQPGQPFAVRGISLADGLTVERVREAAQACSSELDTTFRGVEADSDLVDGLDRFAQQAYDMISSPRARAGVRRQPGDARGRRAVRRADASARAACWRTRLVEAGVRFVTVTIGGWDTHGNNFKQRCKTSCCRSSTGAGGPVRRPRQNAACSTRRRCSSPASSAGRRRSTRTPAATTGRGPCSCLMAGGGMRGGQVLGASDDAGHGPGRRRRSRPTRSPPRSYHPRHRPHASTTPTGRPVMIVREGSIIKGLIA